MRKLFSLLPAYSIMSLLSCSHDKFETDTCGGISYSQTIVPLVNSRCAVSGCHVEGFQPGDFTDYEILKGKAADGKLQLMVFDLNLMPPQDKLTKEEKTILECWVANGATQD
jgi:hypothetical protein